MKALTVIAVLLFAINAYSQQTVKPEKSFSDRKGAVLIIDDTVYLHDSPVGYGFKQEFSSSPENPQSFEKEHNTVWFLIKPEKSCKMEFTLIPDKVVDDYDFMFLKCDSPCNSSSGLTVLRSNISRNNKSIGSVTGLSEKKGKADFVGQGPGNAFSKPVRLKAGQTYFLVLDNVYKNGGGSRLFFKYSNCLNTVKQSDYPYITLIITDKETHEPVNAKVLLTKMNYPDKDDTLINRRGMTFIKKLETGKYYELLIKADSFLSYKTDFKVYSDDSVIVKKIELQKIAPGKKIILDNIFFRGGTADILRKSYPALRNLVFIMKENPQLEIEIQGHVNQPYNTVKRKKEDYYLNLSEARAIAVYDYLIKRGIDASRLTYKGFGYSKMLFPYAKTPDEEQQNRRVEILIKRM